MRAWARVPGSKGESDDHALRCTALAYHAGALDARGARRALREQAGELRRREPNAGVPPPQPERPHPRPAGRRPRHLGVDGDQPLPRPQARQGTLAEDGGGRGPCLPVESLGDDRARGAGHHGAAPPRLSPRERARPEEGGRCGRALPDPAPCPRRLARRQAVSPGGCVHGGGPERRVGAQLVGPGRSGRGPRAPRPGVARPLYGTARVRARAAHDELMIGITSYGAYIPMLRLPLAAIAGGKPGGPEKAVAGWDEDAITMGVAAAIDCLRGIDRRTVDAVLFASTSYPFKEKQAAAIVARALDLRRDVSTADVGDSLRAGTTALRAAVDAVKADSAKRVLVVASDTRMAAPRSAMEASLGDAAAAFLVGDADVALALAAQHTVADE